MILLPGDCLELLPTLKESSVDAIVCDPPYGLTFRNSKWDKNVPGPEYWREVLRVAKPGAHLLAFGGTRTYHRLACAIEDAGFEIRDSMQWLYGQGFPKSHNYEGGFGTALKPACEPIVLARKPLEGSTRENLDIHGTGCLNIERARIGKEVRFNGPTRKGKTAALGSFAKCNGEGSVVSGRWPANVLLDEAAAELLDQQSGFTKGSGSVVIGGTPLKNTGNCYRNIKGDRTNALMSYGDSGGASRFFYVAKASRKERGANSHPTVKPLALMRYLIRLITPPDGIVLDPFMGSGTTGLAAYQEGFEFIGIELTPEYFAIAEKRIADAVQNAA